MRYILILFLSVAVGLVQSVCTSSKNLLLFQQSQAEIESLFKDRELDKVEGIWVPDDRMFELAIIKNNSGKNLHYEYLGIVTLSREPNLHIGDIKLMLSRSAQRGFFDVLYYLDGEETFKSVFNQKNDVYSYIWLPVENSSSTEQKVFIKTYPETEGFDSLINPTAGKAKSGTGFFISSSIVATNYHIISGTSKVSIFWNGINYPAKILETDPVNDLVLLEVSTLSDDLRTEFPTPDVKPFLVADEESVSRMDTVYTFEFPLLEKYDQLARLEPGVILSLEGYEEDPRMFSISTIVSPGSSGGPLLNKYGEVIGIVTSVRNNEIFYYQRDLRSRSTSLIATLSSSISLAIKIRYLQNLVSTLHDKTELQQNRRKRLFDWNNFRKVIRSSIVIVQGQR